MKNFCLALTIFAQINLQTCSPLASEGVPIEILPNTAQEAHDVAHWFDQKLDHFDPSNNKTWKQRYYYYDYWYQLQKDGYPKLPLFLIIGGEGPVENGGYTTDSPMYHLGRDFRALIMHMEHRYYGESKPTDDMSTENLKYLSSRQAVEDIVYFVKKMKKKFKMNCNNEVIVFGGSYPGALAAWVRHKHPDVISVAHASGAPILNIFDFSGYNEVVRKSIELYDKNCASIIHQGAQKQQELMETEEGLKTLSEKFKTCRKLESDEKNKEAFFNKQLSTIGQVVQYNGTKQQDIPAMCQLLTDSDEDEPIDKLANYLINTTKTIENGTCTGYSYKADIEDTKKTDWEKGRMFRQFQWQECTEFGFFMASNKDDSFYANTLSTDFYTDRCKDVYGDIFTPEYIKQKIDESNEYYGGLDYTTSKCLFTQGELDPWQAAGIKESNDEVGYKALIIKNMGHVRDQATETSDDPPELVEGRKEINKILKGWIEALDFTNLPDEFPPINCDP